MNRWTRIDPLVATNVAFVAAILLHFADHLSRGVGELREGVLWGGAVLALIGISTLALTLRRDPRAPLAAAVVGLTTAVAVSLSHLAPHWSRAFSDPYAGRSLALYSWLAVLAEIATAFAFALAGLSALERRPGRAPSLGSRP